MSRRRGRLGISIQTVCWTWVILDVIEALIGHQQRQVLPASSAPLIDLRGDPVARAHFRADVAEALQQAMDNPPAKG